MKLENQHARRKQIEAVAYEVLADKGYKATSMLAIAKRAKASNETLYNWYGSKQTLFRSLVEANALEVTELLKHSIEDKAPIKQTLERLGPVLLRMVTGDRAIALSRAAAADADETGTLGQTLSKAGRESVVPFVVEALELARDRSELSFDNTGEVAELYLNVLIGDLQIRRAIGACPMLTDAEIRHRAERALTVLKTVYGG